MDSSSLGELIDLMVQFCLVVVNLIKCHVRFVPPECLCIKYRVPTAQGIQGKWQKKIPVRENTGNLEIFSKHRKNIGNLVCSSCKFPDSKGKIYFEICRENFKKELKLDKSAKSVLFSYSQKSR